MDKKQTFRSSRNNIRRVEVGNLILGGGEPLFLIAGPCVVEDVSICIEIATEMSRLCEKFSVNYIFKASYDKANKTIKDSYRGPGWLKGLKVLEKIKAKTNVPILTDVHEREQCQPVADVADIIQIPSLLSKQIDLILAAAETGKAVNIKKGQFTAPCEMNNIISRLIETDYKNFIITERGYMFGYQTLISDMRSLQIISQFNFPVVFDCSHSVNASDSILSGTKLDIRDFIRPLMRSAVANGVDGIFLETHPDPDKALSDSVGTYPLGDMELFIKEMVEIDRVIN